MTEQFGIKDGFFVAAALTGYDEATGLSDNKKYGELEFSYNGWGKVGLNVIQYQKLDVHPCSDEELGLVKGPNTMFYPIFKSSVEEVQLYKKNFKCV